MLFRRVLSFGAAVMTALSCGFSVMAEEEEEEPIKFKYDKSMVVSDKDKVGYTFSFDKDDWQKYIKLTPDSKKAGLSIESTTKAAYQGATLKVYADNSSDIGDAQNQCWMATDATGANLYPDATEDDKVITMGLEIDAKDLGVTTFDGAMVVFTYRFDEDGVNSLMGNSVYAFTAKDDYSDASDCKVIKKNTTTDDNIKQFRDAMINAPLKGNTTKIIIEIPVQKSYSGEIMSIDNLDICLQGDAGSIKNLDGYNESATPKETVEELEITGKGGSNAAAGDESTADSEDKKPSTAVIIIVVVAGSLVFAGIVVFFVVKKNKFL